MTTTSIQEADPSMPISVLWHWEDSPLDDTLLGNIIGATTDTYADQRGLGRTTQDLADLHSTVRGYCTERYRDLRETNDGLTKEEINTEPTLFALNSVRKTLHQAMLRRHKESSRPRLKQHYN